MQKALFLDRDGVINKEINYLHRIEDFEFINGIFDLCHFFLQRRFLIFVVTNQAGIARGFYTEKQFANLTAWMVEQFKRHDVLIQEVYYCPYHAEAGIGEYKKDSNDRKPKPGMLLKARDKYALDLANSVLVGDKESDIAAGRNAGVGSNILFSDDPGIAASIQASFVVQNLRDIPALLSPTV